jgi:hypothetical protein
MTIYHSIQVVRADAQLCGDFLPQAVADVFPRVGELRNYIDLKKKDL